jgi:hypothetical protein
MAGDSKFIQITATSLEMMGRIETQLFAVDSEGDVWQYHFRGVGKDEKAKWVQLSSERK